MLLFLRHRQFRSHKSIMFSKLRIPQECLLVILIVLFVRLALMIWVAVFARVNYTSLSEYLLLWHRWDAIHYTELAELDRIASQISETRLAFISRFPPLYPFLVRTALDITQLSPNQAAMLVSFGFLLAASIILFKLMRAEGFATTSSLWAVLCLNIFPTSYFATAGYSEPLFIALLIGYFYAVRIQKNFALGAVLLGFALITRTIGVVALLAHALIFLKRFTARTTRRWEDAFWLVLPALACLVPLCVNLFLLKMPGYQADFEQGFYATTLIPFYTTAKSCAELISQPQLFFDERFMFTLGWPALFVLVLTPLYLIHAKRLSWEYNAFSLAYIGGLSFVTWPLGVPRYWFAAVPLFMSLSLFRSIFLKSLLSAFFVAGLLYFSLVFTSGHFAF